MSEPPTDPDASRARRVPVDLAERLLTGGVVVDSDVTLVVADVDLVAVNVRALARPLSPARGRPA